MNQDKFVDKYQSKWDGFEAWLAQKARLDIKEGQVVPLANDVPHIYRQLCHHLSLAQSRNYSAYLVDYLNQLVLRGHQYIYGQQKVSSNSILQFMFVGFPRVVRDEKWLVLLGHLLFYGPLFAVVAVIQIFPDFVYSIIDPQNVEQIRSMYNPDSDYIGRARDADDDFKMFGFYIYNNVSIDFKTFAGGIFYGLGSIFFMVFNGLHIGAVFGYLIHIEYGTPLFSFVAGHSAFELTAITLSGAAGMKIGFALVAPGRKTRGQALKDSAKISLQIMYGAMTMTALAAFIEAFWSSKTFIDPQIKYTVGIVLWVLTYAYLLFAGRQYRKPATRTPAINNTDNTGTA